MSTCLLASNSTIFSHFLTHFFPERMQRNQQLRGNLRDGLHRGQHRGLYDPPWSHAGRTPSGARPRRRRRPHVHGLPRLALRHGQAVSAGEGLSRRPRNLLDLRRVVASGVDVSLPGATGNEGVTLGQIEDYFSEKNVLWVTRDKSKYLSRKESAFVWLYNNFLNCYDCIFM